MTNRASFATTRAMPLVNLHDLPALGTGVTYQPAAPAAHGPRPAPFLLAGPIPPEFDHWYYGDQWVPDARVFSVPNLHVAGDVTLTFQNQTLTIPQNEVDENSIAREAAAVAATHAIRVIPGQVVVLPGAAYRIYGHWLVDFLPRLHVLTTCGHDIQKLRYLLPAAMPAYVQPWLSLLGIQEQNILRYDPTRESCRVMHALIPTALRGHSGANPFFAEAATALARPAGPPPQHATRKLYVSRRARRRPTRRLVNVEAIEHIFESHGFEIVFPEQLAIPDQIRLFQSARLIAGEYGSGLHNAMFSPPGATILALRGTLAHPWFLQSGLCAVMNQRCGYIFGKAEMFLGNQVFHVNPEHARAALEQLNA